MLIGNLKREKRQPKTHTKMRKIMLRSVLMIAGLGIVGLFAFVPGSASAANPATINFQGKVVNTDGTNVSGGVGTSFVFRLYQNVNINTYNPNSLTCASDPNCLWEETDSLSVTNGVFQVELGAVCPFFTTNACNKSTVLNFNNSNALSLTMKYAGDTNFMTPLMHLQSVPYAYNADNLDGIGASGFIQNNTGAAQSSTSFHIDGTGIADVKLQSPSFDTATTNGALGIGTSNAGAITLGNTTNSTFLFTPKSSATAVVFQNTSSKAVLTLDTSSSQLVLGTSSAGGVNGTIIFKNTSNTNTLTIVTGATAASGGSGFTLTLPTTGASASGQCLQSGAGSTVGSTNLTFSSCGSGSGTLKNAYDAGSTNGGTIALTSTGGGLVLQDASTPLTGNLFAVQSNLGSLNFLTLSLVSSVPHLRIYDQTTNTNYAEIYFDHATSTAIFKANGTNATQVGNAGGGAINIASGSGNAITITAGAASTWSTSAGALTIDAGGGLNIGTSTSTIVIGQTSGGTTQVQSAGGLVLGTASLAGKVAIYNGSNNVVIQSAGSTAQYTITLPSSSGSANYCLANTGTAGVLQFVACGAGSTAQVMLSPEFAGAVMTADGANNSGTMTSDFCGRDDNNPATGFPDVNTTVCNTNGDFHNYYSWTSNGANDYDIFVRWRVPSDFSSFSSVQFNSKKSATGDDVKMTMYTNAGAGCGTATSMTNTASAWQTTTYTIGACAPSAGDILIFDIHMAVAANGNTCQMGEIPITYTRK